MHSIFTLPYKYYNYNKTDTKMNRYYIVLLSSMDILTPVSLL